MTRFFYIITLLFFINTSAVLYSQIDSTNGKVFDNNILLNDGILIDYKQLILNSPLLPLRVSGASNQSLIKDLLINKELIYFDDFGVKTQVPTSQIFGYIEKGVFFVQVNKEFHRVTMMGTISHLFVNKTVYQSRYTDPYAYGYDYGMTYPVYETNQLVQYLINIKTGEVCPMDIKTVELLIASDTQLLAEYSALKKRKKSQMALLYIRRFNERNPIYIKK